MDGAQECSGRSRSTNTGYLLHWIFTALDIYCTTTLTVTEWVVAPVAAALDAVTTTV
jgi:hypothetical protein